MEESAESLISKIREGVYSDKEVYAFAQSHSNDYDKSKEILECGFSRAFMTREADNGKTCDDYLARLIGLSINSGVDPKDYLERVTNANTQKMMIVRGFHAYKQFNYDLAYKLFSDARYKRGLDLCNVALKRRKRLMEGGDKFLSAFVDSSTWPRYRKERGTSKSHESPCLLEDVQSKDIQYRIGTSTTYAREDSVDVILENIKYDDSFIMKLKDIRDKIPYTAEIDYTIGKIYHRMGDLDKAAEHYYESIISDPAYLPAVYNYCRLKNIEVNNTHGISLLEDHNAMVRYKAGCMKISLEKCKTAKRFILMNTDKEYLKKEVENELRNPESTFKRTLLLNNAGVLLKKGEYLQEAIGTETDQIKIKYMKYNLGVMKEDTGLLRSLDLKEADKHVEYLEYQREKKRCRDPEIETWCRMQEEDGREEALGIIEKMNLKNNIFLECCEAYCHYKRITESCDIRDISNRDINRDISNGSAFSEDVLESVYALCRNNSFYCLNILAVLYSIAGYYSKAEKIQRQLERDTETDEFSNYRRELLWNMVHTQVLSGNAEGAVGYLLKLENPGMGLLREMLLKAESIELVDKVIQKNKTEENTLTEKNIIEENIKTENILKEIKVQILLKTNLTDAEKYAKEEGIYEKMKEKFEEEKTQEKRRELYARELEENRKRYKSE